ncbi:MAG: DNRLRE domain-containing protein [Bacteroidota bacterium]
MRQSTTLFLILTCLLGFFSQKATAQVAPVFDQYVQEGNNGSSAANIIYLRNANGFTRVGYLVFDLCAFNSATTADLVLTISNFNAGLANPQTVNIFATGSDWIPAYTFDNQPDNADLDSLGSVVLDDMSTELTFDLLGAINTQISAGANFLVVKLESPTSNAFVQFHSLESTTGLAPAIMTDAVPVVNIASSTSGYVQENQTVFNTSLVYLRNASGFAREGYAAFPLGLSQTVTQAKLRLYVSNIGINTLTDVDIVAYEGDITSGLDYANQPTTGGTVIGTVSVVDTATTMQIDVTNYVNTSIAAGNVTALTFRLSSTTGNALAQFHSNDNPDASLHPSLVIASTCIPSLEARQEVLCVGDTLFTSSDTFFQTGVYMDTLTSSCGADSIIQYDAFFIEDNTVTIDTAICSGETLTVFNGVSNVEYTTAGIYTDSTTTGSCTYKVITNLAVLPSPEPNLGADQTIMETESIVLDPGAGFSTYAWSTGENTPTLTVNPGVNASLGSNTFSVTVTNADGCEASDQITVIVEDAALKPTKDAAMREDKNGFFKQGGKVELKKDLFGDLSTPRGEGPFFNRESYFGFDISGFSETEVTSAVFRLAITNFSPVPFNNGQLNTLEIPVSLDFVPELYMDTMTYPNRYSAQDFFSVQTNLIIMNADNGGFIEFEMTDFLNDEILAKNIDQFTLVVRAEQDTSSTLIRFGASDNSDDALRPRIVWTSPVSIEEFIHNTPSLKISPNPAYDFLEVSSEAGLTEYRIMDMQGKVIQTGDLNRFEPTRVSLSNLTPGLYIMAAISDGAVLTRKFLKE